LFFKNYRREVIGWAVSLRNEGKKCENTSTENYWPEHAIREGKAKMKPVVFSQKKSTG